MGSVWAYGQALTSTAAAISYLKSSLGKEHTPLLLEQTDTDEGVWLADTTRLIHVVDYSYSSSKALLNGISSNTPIEVHVGLTSSYVPHELRAFTFSEVNMNLVVRDGRVTFEEPGIEGSVY